MMPPARSVDGLRAWPGAPPPNSHCSESRVWLRVRLTVGPARKLFRVSKQKLNWEARFVIAIESGRVERCISAQERRMPLAWRVHHDHNTEVAVERHMVEALVIAHKRVVFRINYFTP
jgi:hypothetical protein